MPRNPDHSESHIHDAHLNPLDSYDTQESRIQYARYLEVRGEEFDLIYDIALATYDFAIEKIRTLAQSSLPSFYADYQPPPMPTVIPYYGDQELSPPGEYIPLFHTLLVNTNAGDFARRFTAVHETVHSVCRSLAGVRETPENETESTFTTAGYLVANSSIVHGSAVNEGLMEFLSSQFVMESDSASAKAIRELIWGYLNDAGHVQTTLTPEGKNKLIDAFLVGKYGKVSNYFLAHQIIKILVGFHPELYPLMILGLVSPRAKFLLLQSLRKIYGPELTRELFRARTSQNLQDAQREIDQLTKLKERFLLKEQQILQQKEKLTRKKGIPMLIMQLRKTFLKT